MPSAVSHLWFLGWIIDISPAIAAIECIPVRRVERRIFKQALRKIRVGDERLAERDCIGMATRDRRLCGGGTSFNRATGRPVLPHVVISLASRQIEFVG